MKSNNIIRIKNLKFSYGTKEVINIPSLEISEKEKVFIYAPSGSGKTTLLNLIAGTLLPSQGIIEIKNVQIQNLSTISRDKFRGNNIGHIFQQFNLIQYLDVKNNILLPLKFNKNRRNNELNEQLYEKLIMELNLKEIEHVKPYELSVGQQQRVACARALIGSPDIIIADEPTSSLDEGNKQKFIEQLNTISKNKIVIFVSHDLSLKNHFDKIINLKEINHV